MRAVRFGGRFGFTLHADILAAIAEPTIQVSFSALIMFHCAISCSISPGTYVFTLWLSGLCMRSKAWLAARVSLRLARLPRTASSAQRSRRLRSTRAAAPGLLARAEVTNTEIFSMGPKLR